MDRLKREGNPPVGQLASPVPQYKRPGSTDYEAVEGQHGAPFATLKDASGNVVSPATEDKLEQVRQLLTGVATEAKLEQARVLLNTISNKDFATQATLEVVQSELALIKSELDNIKQNQTSGDQIVQLSGRIVAVTIVDSLAIADTNHHWYESGFAPLSEFDDFSIVTRNTLGVDVAMYLRIIDGWGRVWDGSNWIGGASPILTIPRNEGNWTMLNSDPLFDRFFRLFKNNLDNFSGRIGFTLKTSTIPTSGSLTMRIIGKEG